MFLTIMPRQGFSEAVICFCRTTAGNFILLRKRTDSKKYAGLWGVPGGGIHFGETPIQAITREIKEETGRDIEEHHLALVAETFHRHKIGKKDYIRFKCYTFASRPVFDPEIKISKDEHMEFQLMPPKDFLKMPKELLIPDTLELYKMATKKGAI